MDVASLNFHPRLPAEEQARADLYALLARLFADAPNAALLGALAAAAPMDAEDARGDDFGKAWEALTQAASAMDEDAARQEYQDLFVGVGKAPVNLYGSFYLAGF